MNAAAEAAEAAGEPLYDEHGIARFCIEGQRHPCPIHWPAEHAAQPDQPELGLVFHDKPRR